MKIRTVTTLVILLSSLLFQTEVAQAKDSIVDGEIVRAGDPLAAFTVRIFNPGKKVCSGSLVAPGVVLTAAHCVVDKETGKVYADLSDFVVAFNRFETEGLPRNSSTTRTVRAVISNPKFKGIDDASALGLVHTANDVALIGLSEDAPGDFTPVAFATASELTTYADTLRIAGYGRESAGSSESRGRLKTAQVTLSDDESSEDIIATLYGSGIGYSGDSGAPLLILNPKKGYRLVGVHNTGTHTAGKRASSAKNFAARISYHRTFIDAAMAKLSR